MTRSGSASPFIRGRSRAQGSGWIGRAQRLFEREPGDTVERGYLLMPLAYQHEAAGDFESGAAAAAEAAAIAERFGDADESLHSRPTVREPC